MSKLRPFRTWALITVTVLCICAVGYAATPTALYWPLKVGNSWTYLFTDFSGATPVTHGQAVKVTGTISQSGATWFVAKTTQGTTNVSTFYYRHDAVGLLTCFKLVPTPYYMIKRPLTNGTTWVMMTSAGGSIHRTITNCNATTTVPAGTFTHCLLITQTYDYNKNLKVLYWYAPNKGEVRCESWDTGKLVDKWVLVAATIK